MEHDHPDCYPTASSYEDAFIQYINNVSPEGFVLLCTDDIGVQSLVKKNLNKKVFTYGFNKDADYKAVDLSINQFGAYRFSVQYHQNQITDVSLRVPGKHNVQNATAAIAVANQLGLDTKAAADAVGLFESTGRRFDLLGTINGITIIDDYAHHPTEIKATLEAAKNRFPSQQFGWYGSRIPIPELSHYLINLSPLSRMRIKSLLPKFLPHAKPTTNFQPKPSWILCSILTYALWQILIK